MHPALLLLLIAPAALAGSPWAPSFTAMARRAVAALSTAQKVSLLHGHSIFDIPYVGNVPGLTVANITLPALHLEDGPQGVADAVSLVTAFPSAGTVLQTWDTGLFRAFGAAMAAEQHAKGANIALAPAVNLARVPWGGRVFEYMGEDPVLAAAMAYHEVQGIQTGTNVSACVKHLALNSLEEQRNSVSETASRRALWELYYAPFQAAVNAGVGAAMCSYNRVNLTYACENAELAADLKDGMGFSGWVMSDWYAQHSTLPAANYIEQEMPGGFFFSDLLLAAVESGNVTLARLDDMVTRLLTPLYALGVVGDAPSPARNIFANATSPARSALARDLAQASIVLLRNEGALLPLAPAAVPSWAVFGDVDTVTGHGSGGVTLPYLVTPAAGLAAALEEAGAGSPPVTYLEGRDAGAAAALAARSGACVVVVGISSSEGADRGDLALPPWHDALVAAVLAANPRTVVVVRCPGACFMPWRDAAPAILFELMPGQESGTSIGRTIVGLNNPSGRLALSFPASMNDTWLGAGNASRYPGVDRGRGFREVEYGEGLFMGYRHYDALGAEPLWPFGHGLTYSGVAYSALRVSGDLTTALDSNVSVTFTLTLAPGSPPGAEVAQLYLAHPPGLGEPPQVLKGFAKVALGGAGGARQQVDVALPLRGVDVAVWDEGAGGWRAVAGEYVVTVGGSSRGAGRVSVPLRVRAA